MTKTNKPPYSIEAEQSVIGGLLVNNDTWDEVSLIINEHNFYLSAHKLIFQTIGKLLSNNTGADILTVSRMLQEMGKIEQIGGLAYLTELVKNTPSLSNINAYADIVKRDSQVRSLYTLGSAICKDVMQVTSSEKLENIISDTEKRLTELTFNHFEGDTHVNLDEVMEHVIDKMTLACEQQTSVTGTSFGIDRLDFNTTGAQAGDLIMVAARPSMGKTALSLTFAKSALESTNKPVIYFSIEMPAEQIMQRFLSMLSRVSMQKAKNPLAMTQADWSKYAQAMGHIKNQWSNRLLLDDSGELTPQLLRTKVRRCVRKYGQPAIILIDYIQLMHDPYYKDGKNRNLEISSISTALKKLAKEINCPVIVLSQLNRNLTMRTDKRPVQSDLRDSGSLEQDADILLFIYRDEVYHADSEYRNVAELIIAKQRNGPIGTIFTKFNGECSLFENIPDEEYNQLTARI